MKKTKLKIKKQVWIALVLIIFGCIGIYSFNKIRAKIEYKKTNEYKLLNIGYSKEDIKLLEEKTNEDTIKNLLNSPKNDFLLSLLKEQY